MNRILQCRIGDLAVIVKAFNKSNIGKIVKVMDTYSPEKAPWLEGNPVVPFDWIIESPSPMVWTGNGKRRRRKRGPVPDFALKPIRGMGKPEQTEQAQPLVNKRKEPVKTLVAEPVLVN